MPFLRRLNTWLAPVGVQLVPGKVHATARELPALTAEIQMIHDHLKQVRIDLLRGQIAARWCGIDALESQIQAGRSSHSCPLCSTTDVSAEFKLYQSHCIFGGGDLIRYQCPGCDLIFGPSKMLDLSDAALKQEYEWHYKVYEEGDSTQLELRAFHALQPKRDGVYLNYGCGAWSRTLEILRAEGWQVFGYEPHQSASADEGKWQLNQEAINSMHFDGIFSNNVLEHFRHPVAELQAMTSWLVPAGRLAHATPCYEYCYEYTRFHLFFYAGRSRKILFEKAGLAEVDHVFDGEFRCCVLRPLSD
jgi:hypothetical protein